MASSRHWLTVSKPMTLPTLLFAFSFHPISMELGGYRQAVTVNIACPRGCFAREWVDSQAVSLSGFQAVRLLTVRYSKL